MTIGSTQSTVTLLGNGVQTVWPFSFLIPQSGQEQVVYTDALGNRTVLANNLYSVAGFGSASGGSVTYPLIGSPIASGTSITISRNVPLVQTTSLSNQGAYLPSAIESAIDYVMMAVQQVNSLISRAVNVPIGDTATSTTLPSVSSRANNVLGFDSSGNPIAVASVANLANISSSVSSAAASATAAAASATAAASSATSAASSAAALPNGPSTGTGKVPQWNGSAWVGITSASGISGPGSSISGDLVSFNGTTGAVIQDAGILASNVVTAAAAGSGNLATIANGAKTISDSGVVAANVVTAAANGAGNIAVMGSGNKTISDSGVSVASIGGAPSGSIMAFAGSSAPTGWLLAYGQAVSRTTYSALFAVISTTYGSGDGSTTFNLPDLRGYAVRGVDNMGGVAAGRITAGGSGITGTTLGATGGAETVTLTIAQMPSHTHTSGVYSGTGGLYFSNGGVNGSTPINTGSQGGGSAHNNTGPTIMLNYIIKT